MLDAECALQSTEEPEAPDDDIISEEGDLQEEEAEREEETASEGDGSGGYGGGAGGGGGGGGRGGEHDAACDVRRGAQGALACSQPPGVGARGGARALWGLRFVFLWECGVAVRHGTLAGVQG